MNSSQEEKRRLVTAADAALIYRVDQRTIRRRLNDGKLDGKKADDGRSWMVWVAETDIPEDVQLLLDQQAADAEKQETSPVHVIEASNIYPLTELIYRLQAEGRELAGQLATVEERLRSTETERDSLAAELEALKSAPIALPATVALEPDPVLEGPPWTPEPVPTVEPEPTPEPESVRTSPDTPDAVPTPTPVKLPPAPVQDERPWWKKWRG